MGRLRNQWEAGTTGGKCRPLSVKPACAVATDRIGPIPISATVIPALRERILKVRAWCWQLRGRCGPEWRVAGVAGVAGAGGAGWVECGAVGRVVEAGECAHS